LRFAPAGAQRARNVNGFPRAPEVSMRTLLLLTLALAAGAAYVLADSNSQSDEAAKQQIRALLDTQAAAWNKGNLQGFMDGYWQSPELSFYSGATKTKGWQATLERYQKRYQAEGREMGKLTFSELEVELAGPDTAWVRGRWQLVTSKEKPGGLFTLILKKLPEGWRIVHDHTSQG
jgi:beta-aspartyl-peptidase (threonine type)